MHALLVGFGLGFLVALQLGPMSLFLIRSTLRRGWAVGLAIGPGSRSSTRSTPPPGAAGAAPLLTIGPLRLVLGLVGAAVLIVLGARTLHSAFRVRQGLEVRVRGRRRRAARSSPRSAATASNPSTIASWAAIFAAASVAGAADSTGGAVAAGRGRRRSAASPG